MDRIPQDRITNSWSEEDVAQLTKLVADGLTSGQIARQVGRTRNAVIGKILRLGLRLRNSPGPTGPRPSTLYKPHVARIRPAKPPVPPRAAALQQAPGASRVYTPPRTPETPPRTARRDPPQGESRFSHCQWYFGDPRAGDFTQCQEKPFGASSYCEHHHRIVYVPPPPRKPNPRSF